MRPRSVALLAVLATAACTGSPTPPPVVRVDRGPVVTTVAASGTLVGISRQNLGFAEGGELAEVLVRVGDRVAAGQVLARLEDADLESALDRAEAQRDNAQALLDKVVGSNAVDAAEASLDQAREVLDATEEQVAATDEANDVATERARVQLDFDREALERAEQRLADDRRACGSPAPTTTPKQHGGGLLGGGAAATPAPVVTDPACERIAADETAVQQAEGTVLASETALATAEQREDVDAASGRLSIENARQGVVSAENTLDTATADRPADTSAQEAALREAEVGVETAQRDLDRTALRAPTAGVVSEINGAVGEVVGPVSGTTTLAPGSSARLPALADAATGGAVAGTGGGAFLVLDGVESFQLVVPFEESDAARVRPGAPAAVTVDAAPDDLRPGSVLAVAPTATDVSGIVNYYATIVLTEGDPLLRDGQTAEASVEVDAVLDVLRVPSSTVRSDGAARVVDVRGEEGEAVATPFVPGAVGDEFTEVRSGLVEGQEVLLPQGQVSAVAGPPRGPN